MKPQAGERAPTVLRFSQPMRRSDYVWLIPLVVLAVGVVGWMVVTTSQPVSLLPLLSAAAPGWFLSRRRVELHEDELVVRKVRTHRIPYTDITAVRGDVPDHLTWSTQLVVERRSGEPITLPAVSEPVPQVRDLIVARAGLE
ncbi:hypothetical protein [Georgenia faecalis]|uniref:PH domain-containing protein n=1 Tax=Georgenia faecalis TaxID=2483799 RepID=A0ABV9D5Y6_9MICO|nr:hypothetical protein [Georgenia faecalis]